MSNIKGTKKQKPRGTREHVESVKRNAAEAGKELDAEQAESVGQLAQALGEISEGEALAHLDSRLAFIERQVERLAARKDEADRGLQGELAVMRARVEDALEAVGSTAEQQRESLALLERRLAGVVADSERGSADVVTTLRKEIVAKVHETARRLEKLDARIRGEMAAFQDGFEERSRALAQSVTEAKVGFEEGLSEATEEVQGQIEAIDAAFKEYSESQSQIKEEIQAEMEAARSRIVEDITARVRELEGNLNELTEEAAAKVARADADVKALMEEVETRAAAARENASSVSESIQEGLASASYQLNRRLDEQLAEIQEQVEGERARIEMERAEALKEAEAQKASLESEIEQRWSAAAATIDQALTSDLGEIRQRIEGNEAKITQELEAHRAEVEASLASDRKESEEKLTSDREKISRTLEDNRAAIDQSLARMRSALEESQSSHRENLEERLSEERQTVEESMGAERREIEGRLSEWGAEVRLESQKLREAVENRSKAVAEALDVIRKELLTRIQASEEKTAGAAIRLKSLLDQQRREIVTDEQEWSGMLNEVGEELSALKIRVEELAGRVSTSEARRAAERGSSNASVESTSARLEALERRVREAVEDMVAKQGTRLEILASQVTGITETEVAAEEQVGAVDYLKRRVGEMAERVDEIVVKVNAIGRYVTKPGTAARLKGPAAAPPGLTERLTTIENAIEKLEAKEPEPLDAGIGARLEALERAIAELSMSITARSEQPPFVSATPHQPGSGIDLSVKVEEPQPKAVSGTILPSKKRRW